MSCLGSFSTVFFSFPRVVTSTPIDYVGFFYQVVFNYHVQSMKSGMSTMSQDYIAANKVPFLNNYVVSAFDNLVLSARSTSNFGMLNFLVEADHELPSTTTLESADRAIGTATCLLIQYQH